MTRHEAKTILQVSGFDEYSADLWLKRYVALGMLKLDEPKSVSDRFIDALEAHVEHKHIGDLLHALDSANLKIVEK